MTAESAAGRGCCKWVRRVTGGVVAGLFILLSTSVQAASVIYVSNETLYPIIVSDITVSGARLSKKAWKRAAGTILPGERLAVLSISRTGKFNWMDPTPRFVEPGKTVFFNSTLVLADFSKTLTLNQKLLGTGSGSKMWYRLQGVTEPVEWSMENNSYSAVWQVLDDLSLAIDYRAYRDKKDTHVEYVVSSPQ